MDHLRDLFDFSKKRKGVDAIKFYLFYLGCASLVMLVLENGI